MYTPDKQIVNKTIYILLTPNGQRVTFVLAPVQDTGLVGGADAKVSPATFQSIGHTVALIVKGGRPESNMGEGRLPPDGVPALNFKLVGSMANSHVPVASNCKSTARGSSAF